MNIPEFITKLKHNHVSLSLVDENLKITGAKGSCSPELIEAIKNRKTDLVGYLKRNRAPGGGGITPAEQKQYYPVSAVQEGLFYLAELDKTTTAYNIPIVLRLEGCFDREVFERTVQQLFRLHECFRTSFRVLDDAPVARIHGAAEVPAAVEYYDATETGLDALLKEFIRPFDLTTPPLVRVGVGKCSDRLHLLLIDMHHSICDEASMQVIVGDLVRLYRGEPVQAAKVQYKDYVAWQRRREGRPAYQAQRHFWLNKFSGPLPKINLPADFTRPAVVTFQGNHFTVTQGAGTSARLRETALRAQTTLFTVVFAAYQVFLAKLCGQDELIVGVVTAGRHHPEAEHMTGVFTTTLPVRTQVARHLTFGEFLRHTKGAVLEAFANQEYPYVELLKALKINRETSRNPLFDVTFNFHQGGGPDLQLPGLAVTPLRFENKTAIMDLSLEVFASGGEIRYDFRYNTHLFKPETVRRFAAYFAGIVEQITARPDIRLDQIELITREEKQQVLTVFNQTARKFPIDTCWAAQFAHQVSRSDDRVAVVHGEHSVSYRELHHRSSALAARLQRHGAGAGDRVVVFLPRGIDFMTAFIAVLKLRGTYIPADENWPLARVESILRDSQAAYVVTSPAHGAALRQSAAALPALRAVVNVAEADPEAGDPAGEPLPYQRLPQSRVEWPAYILYTSGTTGRPKGVMIHEEGMLNHLFIKIEELGLSARDHVAQTAPVGFDISIWQALAGLLAGGTTCILDHDTQVAPRALAQALHEAHISVLEMVPSLMKLFLDDIAREPVAPLPALRWVLLTGESLPASLVQQWYGLFPHAGMINAYGPTEASDDITHYRADPLVPYHAQVPIGKPLPNLRIYVLNPSGQLCPIGVKGELCVAGIGVGMGYWQDAQKTQRAFVPNPFHDPAEDASYAVMYRTGDLGYYQPDGNLVFLGRQDDQVKIRGNRIELAEVEQQLMAYPALNNVVVAAVAGYGDDDKQLCAYFTADEDIETAALRKHLGATLPAYMIPSHFVRLEQIPLTENGKVDKKRLPAPEPREAGAWMGPGNDTEATLLDVWRNVLRNDSIGVTTNFFEAGGDSISTIRIASALRKEGYEVSFQDIFRYQSIRELAGQVRKTASPTGPAETPGLNPFQHWYLSQPGGRSGAHPARLLRLGVPLEATAVESAFAKLMDHHDALRLGFRQEPGTIVPYLHPPGRPVSCRYVDLGGAANPLEAMLSECAALVEDLSPEGDLVKLGLFRLQDEMHLLIAIHKGLIDEPSWGVLVDQLEALLHQHRGGEALKIPYPPNGFGLWSYALEQYQAGGTYAATRDFWRAALAVDASRVPRDFEAEDNRPQEEATESLVPDAALTGRLLTRANKAFHTHTAELLGAALAIALHRVTGREQIRVDFEDNGRAGMTPEVDLTQAVGPFAHAYPLSFGLVPGAGLSDTIVAVKEQMRKSARNSWDYPLLQYADGPAPAEHGGGSRIGFGYREVPDFATGNRVITGMQAFRGPAGGDKRRAYEWFLAGELSGGTLTLRLVYSRQQYRPETVRAFVQAYAEALGEVVTYCAEAGEPTFTPSDFTFPDLTPRQVRKLQSQYELQDVYPLSPMQEGMLFHYLLNPGGHTYLEQIVYRISGAIHLEPMAEALEKLAQRYDILRTVFAHDGLDRPVQVVLRKGAIGFSYHDLTAAGPGAEAEADARRAADQNTVIALETGPLMRITLLKLNEREYEFIWTFHHIIMDGWCMSILIAEFNHLYGTLLRGGPVVLPVPRQYAEYIKWLGKIDRAASRAYWKNYLDGYETTATLPRRQTAPAGGAAFVPEETGVTLEAGVQRTLERVARQVGVTQHTLFQAAWGLLLSKYNFTSDVVYGTVVSGRPAEIEGIDTMVGLFINTVPVRIAYRNDQTVEELLRQVQRQAVESEPFHYDSLAGIQAATPLGRDLLDHIMVFENFPLAAEIERMTRRPEAQLDAPDSFAVSSVRVSEQTNYDFTITIVPGQAWQIVFSYNAAVFEPAFISRLSQGFVHTLMQLVKDVKRPVQALSFVTAAEAEELLHTFNNSQVDYPADKTFVDLFEEQVERSAPAVAVRAGAEVLTYRQLNEQANQLAHYLVTRLGIGPGDRLGLLADRNAWMVVGVLGILKAGATVVPIDRQYPPGRIAHILDNARPKAVLTDSEIPLALPGAPGPEVVCLPEITGQLAGCPAGNLPRRSTPGDLVYILYTSGSQGLPKGVMVEHRNVVSIAMGWRKQYGLETFEVRLLQLASISFDVYFGDLCRALLHGGQLVVCPAEVRVSYPDLYNLIREHAINIFESTPALVIPFAEYVHQHGLDLSWMKVLIVGSDVLLLEDYKSLLGRFGAHTRIINSYGTTETTIDSSFFEASPGEVIAGSGITPIGKPFGNNQYYVLDAHGQLLPVGAAGELYIGGAGVSRGYMHNEKLTAERFVGVAGIGERLYKSGDLARWQPDGNLVFLGRNDRQVKLRGYRIEPEEIETQLNRHPRIEKSVVMIRQRGEALKFLCAYYAAPTPLPKDELRACVAAALPDYMVPDHFEWLEKLPLTPNGKVDRQALPEPEFKATNHVPPATLTEEELLVIWSEVLQLEKAVISADHNFFEIGGHSLLATTLLNRIVHKFNVEIKLADLFTAPTLKGMADLVETKYWLKNLNKTGGLGQKPKKQITL
jgi:amino acid adenylation domain-containing protein/non-ribosomal peptide synthase protein (TIGR01720 family)